MNKLKDWLTFGNLMWTILWVLLISNIFYFFSVAKYG